jgi:hypothetical protein
VRGASGLDEPVNLLSGEDVGERLGTWDLELLQGGPVARDGAAIEELDAVEGEGEGGRGEAFLVLEEEEVLAELGLGDLVGRAADVLGELADGAKIGFLGALAEAGELEVGAHLLAQRCGATDGAHERLLS